MQSGETPESVPSLKAEGAHSLEVPDDAAARQMELVISRLLRTGVVVSVSIVLLGLVLMFLRHPDYATDRSGHFLQSLKQASEDYPHTFSDLFAGLKTFQGRSIVLLGLTLLVLTPILRVVVSILTFGLEKDRRYVGITLIVLALLTIAFLIGGAE